MALKNVPAAVDREFAEYQNLCASLGNLHENFLRRKQELRRILEESAARRRDALLVLLKANRLTRHLSGRQRQLSGLSYHLGEIKNRINQTKALIFQGDDEAETLPAAISAAIPAAIPAEFRNQRELKQKGLLVLSLIDTLRKRLLQLDLLELRCRELKFTIQKALEAFHHEFLNIRRKLFPFGIFSTLRRSLRSLSGNGYFLTGDLDEIAALGRITGLVLKIADSPIM